MQDDGRIHFSSLKAIAESPQHYQHAIKSGRSSAAMKRGTATHALIFGDRKVVVYDGIRRGKEWEQFQREHQDVIIANEREYAEAEALASAVRTDPTVRKLNLLGEHTIVEKEILWNYWGRPWSSTPDIVCPSFMVDLKTTRSAKPKFFHNDALRMYYHVQAALYRLAVERQYGYLPQKCYLVAVSAKPPHAVVVNELSPKLLRSGELISVCWMEQYLQCESANHWPGYATGPVLFDVPEWDMSDEEDEEEEDESEAAQ